jgi:hypothetical protein
MALTPLSTLKADAVNDVRRFWGDSGERDKERLWVPEEREGVGMEIGSVAVRCGAVNEEGGVVGGAVPGNEVVIGDVAGDSINEGKEELEKYSGVGVM